MNNLNISPRNNQAFSKQYISILYWMGGSLSGYHNYNPLSIPYVFTSTRKNILSVILRFCGLYRDAYLSQEKIAELSGCHHDTVLRAIKLFVELGILKKKYRGANRTCVYSLTSFFHNERVQWALKDIIPNLYWSIKEGVRKCKKFLSELAMTIYKPNRANYKPVTARLSNDKNKSINTKKISIKNNHEDLKMHQKTTLNYEPNETHNKLFHEFASILGIS